MSGALHVINPSMSKADLLLQCAYPWGRQAPRETSSPEARFGSAVHEVVAAMIVAGKRSMIDAHAIAERYGVGVVDVATRALHIRDTLMPWLGGANPYKTNFLEAPRDLRTEMSIAYRPKRDSARVVPVHDGEHVYDVNYACELPGTADVVARGGGRGNLKSTILILDHKTGRDVPSPRESAQLKTLALAFSRHFRQYNAVIGFVHAPADDLVTIYTDELDKNDLLAHRTALREAWSEIDAKRSVLRPNPLCGFCPALVVCPTQSSTLEMLGRTKLTLDAANVGRIHQQLAVYDRLVEKMRDEMKAYVKKHGPVERPDGKVIDIQHYPIETLSKASVKRALGPVKGERELERLRKLGCVEESEREELRALND